MYSERMLPAGYLWKRVGPPPGWLNAKLKHVRDVCSVAGCVNDNVVDVEASWQHNSFGVANNPRILATLAAEAGTDLRDATLFYYAAYEREIVSDGWTFDADAWRPRTPVPSASVTDCVELPGSTTLLGFDVVVIEDFISHSPLSCNSVAQVVPVNEHCLFGGIEEAVGAISASSFGGGCEEGTYTVFAVHLVNRAGQDCFR
jgi:hypothetical protein